MRHEAAAGHAAEGYARATGRAGVAIGTSGPGATNLVTPIADASMDSVPTLFITGQVKTTLRGTDAFQEADVIGITQPIVKHSFAVERADDVAQTVRRRAAHRHHRPAGAGADRPPERHRGRAGPRRHAAALPARPPPAHPPQRATGALGGPGDRRRATPRAVRGRRRRAGRRRGRVDHARPCRRPARDNDADGTRCLSGKRPAAGSACSACTGRASPTGRWTRPT